VDRKIVEWLVLGKSHRDIKRELGVGGGRLAKVMALAEEHGYLSGRALPAYPEVLFPERVDARGGQQSEVDALIASRAEWIKERLAAGWKAVTVFEELQLAVTRSSFYRFLQRHGLDEVSRAARAVRVVPEIVHAPGEALLVDWGKLCTVLDPVSGARRTLWVLIAVLGFSRYLCARVVWRNDVATTLAAIESIWQELGGVSRKLTSDNPKQEQGYRDKDIRCIHRWRWRVTNSLNDCGSRFNCEIAQIHPISVSRYLISRANNVLRDRRTAYTDTLS